MAFPIDHIPDRQVYIDGKPHLYFGGTAYLGVQNHPEFIEIFTKNIRTYGLQYGASRRSNVFLAVYAQAEQFLADWVGSEACITLSSGYLAAQSVIQKLLEEGHVLFAAPNAHTALLRPGVTSTSHYGELKTLLELEIDKNTAAPVLLFDTIDFSGQHFPDFDGLQSLPLDKLILVGDDSHGIGVVGEEGSGCFGYLQKLGPAELLVCCSLGKGMGIQAGAIFGTGSMVKKLRNTSFYGGASPALPAFMGTLLETRELYQKQRAKLMENYALFRNNIDKPSFFNHLEGHPTFEFVDAELAKSLESNGIVFTNFTYPDENGPLVSRLVLSAYHKKEDVLQLANCLNTLLS